ncbi:hypothetical protein HDU87_006371 [Geranomyces variabilis]|uniref:Uncharacterized protein n=1 Tax=Geranomyces variabilis TaxID=109894 RepID=A0AAD5TG06_9FUNG|nr:hypothetical protein HDU87_006371 [Geranomyces variabilis]
MQALAFAVWLALASGPTAAQNLLFYSTYTGSDCSGGIIGPTQSLNGRCLLIYNSTTQASTPVQYSCNSTFVTASLFTPITTTVGFSANAPCPGSSVNSKTVPVLSLIPASATSVVPGGGFPWFQVNYALSGDDQGKPEPAGGPDAGPSTLGATCTADSQCTTAQCTDGICSPGGALAAGKACFTAADCASGNCLAGSCAVKGKEAGIGQACNSSDSCESGKCAASVCTFANTGPGALLVANRTSTVVGFKPNVAAVYSLPGNLGLALTASAGAIINVTVSPDPPTGLTAPAKGISTYYNFDLSTNSSFSANLTFVYVDALLTALSYDPANLAWARFNTDTQKWESKPGSVDTVAKTVTYQTSSFSTWTVISVTSAATRLALTPAAFLVVALTMMVAM